MAQLPLLLWLCRGSFWDTIAGPGRILESHTGNGMQDRLIELESKFSFQEDSLQELNEVLIKQQRQLDEMRQLVESLRERIADLEAGGGDGGAPAPGSERPPHY